MGCGYIKTWRKALDSAVFKNPIVWYFWSWCLMKAAWKPTTVLVGFQKVDLLPGQFIFGRAKAAKELKLSEKSIRTCLKTLKNLENVAIKTASKFSVITICNWEIYQGDTNQNGHQNGQQGASKGPARGHKEEVKAVQALQINAMGDINISSSEEKISDGDISETTPQPQHENSHQPDHQKAPKKTKTKKFTEEDMAIAVQFKEQLQKDINGIKPPSQVSLETWADTIRMMRELDKRDVKEIQGLIAFTHTNNFWRKNILSIPKLREKQNRLLAEMVSKPSQGGSNGISRTGFSNGAGEEFDFE